MKKNYKNVIKPLILIFVFTIPILMQLSSLPYSGFDSKSTDMDNIDDSLYSSAYDDDVSGWGNDRTCRVFLENMSSATGTDDFDIGADSDDEFLSGGQFNFTFDKNYNTTYDIESDTPLEYPKSTHNSLGTDIFNSIGTIGNLGTNASVQDVDNTIDWIQYDSETSGSDEIVSLNVEADFSNYGASNKTILGFSIEMSYELETTDILMNVSAEDHIDSNWDQFYTDYSVNASGTLTKTMKFNIRNENLRYRNWETKNASFSIVLFNSTSDSFTFILYGIEVKILTAQEVAINKNQEVALEFQTLGNATIYGFQAWIRSFNTTSSEDSELNITLYHTNRTSALVRSSLLQSNYVKASPDKSEILTSTIISNYNEDKPIWFNFTISKDLNISSFFIVIKTNTTDTDTTGRSYSLVTLPKASVSTILGDPNERIDHLLLYNATADWNLVPLSGYTSYQCDAAAFSLNITRGWMASDLNATLDESNLSNMQIDENIYPRDDYGVNMYGVYWWGLGTIEHEFSTDIQANAGVFNVVLNWNDVELSLPHLNFNVSYNVIKYVNEGAKAYYTMGIEMDPRWEVNFTLTQSNYPEWNFKEMWYFLPLDWSIEEFYAKNGSEILTTETEYEYDVEDQQILKIFNETTVSDVSNGDGNYTLIGGSDNYIKTCTLSLDYNGTLWETNGYMFNDNVSIEIGVASASNDFVDSGVLNVDIYYPNGTMMPHNSLTDSSVDQNNSITKRSIYELGDAHILESNNSIPVGKYNIIGTWTNGDQVGIINQYLFLNNYSASIIDVYYDRESQSNYFEGLVSQISGELGGYNFYLYAIQDNDDSEYYVNHNETVGLVGDMNLLNYSLNETVLNPGETIKLNIELQNINTTLDYDTKIVANIIYAMNNEWVVANSSSSIKNLAIAGDPSGNDIQDYDIEIDIPSLNEGGLNCPLRLSPLLIELVIFSDEEKIMNLIQPDVLYLSLESENDFEAQVVSVDANLERFGPSFLASMERTNFNLPNDVQYFIQVANQYYMTMDYEYNITKSEKLDLEILDFQALQSNLNQTSKVNITGKLVDEFGEIVAGKNLSLYYDDENGTAQILTTLDNMNSVIVDEDGMFSFVFDLSSTPKGMIANITIGYDGDSSYYEFNETLNLPKNTYENYVELSLSEGSIVVGENNYVSFSIVNSGNSTLNHFVLSYLNMEFDGTITQNDKQIDSLLPGESLHYTLILHDTEYTMTQANVTLLVTASSVEDGVVVSAQNTFTFRVLRTDQGKLLQNVLISVFIIGAVLFWIYTIQYSKRNLQDANILPESTPKARIQKTGKYVKVSELSRKSEESDDSKTLNEDKSDNSEGTSLDDLIDEEKNSS